MMKNLIIALGFSLGLCGAASAQFLTPAIPTSLPASSITVGTTTISGGSSGRVEYNNAGVLGEMTTSGSGTVLCLQTSCAMVTPSLGVAIGTSLALGGAGTGAVLDVTGTASISSTLSLGALGGATGSASTPAIRIGATNTGIFASSISIIDIASSGATVARFSSGGMFFPGSTQTIAVSSGGAYTWSSGTAGASGPDTFLTRPSAATIQAGAADVDTAPVAQTLRTQGALAGGTSNVAGANWTFIASLGKGTGAGGSFIFQTAPAGSTGTVVNAPVTGLSLNSAGLLANATIISDAALVDTAVCQDTTLHGFHSGSAALGACLGTSSRDSKISNSIAPIAASLIRSEKVAILQWRYKTDPAHLHYGPIADDVCEAYQTLCARDAKGKIISYDWTSYIFLLLEKDRADMKNERGEIVTLRATNDNLARRIATLEHRRK